MGVSKVVYGDNTLVDLTNDSVSAATLAKGITAHNSAGDQVTGTMEAGTSVTKETITEALGYTPTKAWYVTFTIDSDNNATADKTVTEIYQAYQDGYAVYGRARNGTGIFQLEAISSNTASFTFVDVSDYSMFGAIIFWDTDNSKWVLANTDISSSGTGQSPLIVNFTLGDQIPNTTQFSVTSVDKTITEIYNAYTNGQIVFAKNTSGACLQLISCSSTYAYFSAIGKTDDIEMAYLNYENNEWTYGFEELESTLVNEVLAALPTWTGGSY